VRRALLVLLALGAACARSVGGLGVVADDPAVIGTQMLRPGVEGHSCRTTVLGVPLRAGTPDVREAVQQMLAVDADANVVVHADVRTRALLTGLYNRRCVDVRGDVARVTSRLVLPAGPGHEHQH